MINRKEKRQAKTAVFAVVHATYFPQFEGLREKLLEYHGELVKKVQKNEVETADFGIVDSSEKAYEVLEQIKASGAD